MTNETLHWDGDTILFVTDAAGNATDFKVGLDGDVTPRDGTFSGLSVYDRDPAGVIVQTSNSTGSTGFNPLDPNTVSGAGVAGTTGYQAANVPEQYVRGDGFMVAGVQINGVRAFDPNLGAWTTPDAYEGEVHDPVSQQRYMWNRGNAAEYSDPSGYNPAVLAVPLLAPLAVPVVPIIVIGGVITVAVLVATKSPPPAVNVPAPGPAPGPPPNPNGRRGGTAHQEGVKQASDDIKASGLRPVTEEHVPTPGGAKPSRFVDVAGQDGDGATVIRIQVGKGRKDGTPVARERKAMQDIQNAPIQFRPYNR